MTNEIKSNVLKLKQHTCMESNHLLIFIAGGIAYCITRVY